MSNATETTNTNTASGKDGTNDTRRRDFINQARTFGREAALGKDSLPKLAHSLVRAAADGVLSTNKNDKGGDDAADIYKEYVDAESKKSTHEHSAGGARANVSKLRQFIAMGESTSISDPVGVMQNAFNIREALVSQNAEANPEDRAKLKPAYHFYVDVARKQLKSDTPLTDDELTDLAEKPEPASKDAEQILKQVSKLLEGLVSGENKHGVKDDSEEVENAYQSIKERLDNVAKLKAVATLRTNAAALGINLAD